MKYIKTPEIIEAIQIERPKNENDIILLDKTFEYDSEQDKFYITLENNGIRTLVYEGCYIQIKEDGSYIPWEKDKFEQNYSKMYEVT